LQRNVVKKMEEVFFSEPSKLSQITHGDAWYNNFMFR
jgi:hypothetical protein